MGHPREYGVGLAPYRPVQQGEFELNLRFGGIDRDPSPTDLEEGGSPNAVDVRLSEGGVSTDFGRTAFGSISASAEDRTIIGISPFQQENGDRLTVRHRPTRWDRWNGVNWLELTGALTGTPAAKLYSLIVKNKLIAANGIDKLKAWDGVDTNAVADLSADAPIASYIARIGSRILAARLTVGGILFPNDVAWSADGVITDWTDPLLGAGGAELLPEGATKAANFITGLSTLARGAVIYRQRSIQLATLTGVGAAPFRFQTVDFNHGTESPYSIASGGPLEGDFFLGHDFVVYYFDGNAVRPIGLQVAKLIQEQVFDLAHVVSIVDVIRAELWVCLPTTSDLTLKVAYIFSIKDFVQHNRIVWRRKILDAGISSVSFGTVPIVNDPLINSVTELINNVNQTFNSFAVAVGKELVLEGDIDGQVWHIDDTLALTTGVWESKQFGSADQEMTIDTIAAHYRCSSETATFEVSLSVDGGLTYTAAKIHTVARTGAGDGAAVETFRVTGKLFMVRLRLLTGFVRVNKLRFRVNDRGHRAAA